MRALSAHPARVLDRVSLRRRFGLSFASLASLAAIASAALLAITLLLHRDSHFLAAAYARDQISRDVETDVLLYAQLFNLGLARGSEEVSVLAERQKKAIGDHLEEARQFASTPGGRALLARLDQSVALYVAANDRVRSEQIPLSDAVQRTGASLQLVLQDLKALEAVAHADMDRAEATAQVMLHAAIAVATTVAVIVAIGVAISLLEVRSKLYRPLLALRDVIKRFAAGHSSARAEESVPIELKEVAHTFNVMAAKIERQRADELASLAGIAHDLRNPVMTLGLLTAPAAIERTVESREGTRRALGLVHRQVERLNRMVSDLLDTARIESGQLRLEVAECDLRDVARAAADLYQTLSDAHQVRLSVPRDPVTVRGDAQRLEQALHNLVSNAIKFSPEGGEVHVSVSTSGERAALTVSDDGIGMSAEQQADIFEPFRRSGPPGIPGAGLGLSLVKKIVEGHGGTIEVESVPGMGSTFRISLPLSTVPRECQPSGH